MELTFQHVAKMPRRLALLVIVILDICISSGAHSSWLFIGKLQALSSTIEPHICEQISLVPAQKNYCDNHPKIMVRVRDGAQTAISECQFQFKNDRWNCSTADKRQVFGKVLQRGSREAAFAHAITSAAVTYEVTRACSRGHLIECSCDGRKRGSSKDNTGKFEWGGCSDDVQFGMSVAEEFIDANEIAQHDGRAIMNLHNNRAGRKTVKAFKKRKCKCHGATDTCPLRTCWEELDEFRLTGNYLKRKYDGAVRVTVRQGSREMTLHTTVSSHKPPTKRDLVYLEDSPNYCIRSEATGSLGTSGRECNLTSKGIDGCALLCCGRGHDTSRVTRTRKCNCRFHFCCEIRCKLCTETLDVYTCKPELGQEEPTRQTVSSSSSNASSAAPTRNSGTAGTTAKSRNRGRKRTRNRKGRKRKRKGRKGRRRKTTTSPVRAKRGVPEYEEDDVDMDLMALNKNTDIFETDTDIFDYSDLGLHSKTVIEKSAQSKPVEWLVYCFDALKRLLYTSINLGS